jgi:CheY-like chemotaxis protein
MDVPTVLVVDDDDSVREVTGMSLEVVAGWQVLQADSGQAALDLARRHRPDAILLDVMMPVMDGPATLRQLRADPVTSEIPVVLLTAKVRAGERAELAELAVQGILAKPFDPMRLHVELARLLGWEA